MACHFEAAPLAAPWKGQFLLGFSLSAVKVLSGLGFLGPGACSVDMVPWLLPASLTAKCVCRASRVPCSLGRALSESRPWATTPSRPRGLSLGAQPQALPSLPGGRLQCLQGSPSAWHRGVPAVLPSQLPSCTCQRRLPPSSQTPQGPILVQPHISMMQVFRAGRASPGGDRGDVAGTLTRCA